MAATFTPRLSYPHTPTVRAHLGTTGGPAVVDIVPAAPGERYDICMPTAQPGVALQLYQEMNARVVAATGASTGELLQGLGKASGAGEFYLQQIHSAERRYAKAVQKVADDFAETRKFKPEHAKALRDARNGLATSLADVYPGISFYRVNPAPATMASTQANARLASDIAAMPGLEGRALQNLERNAVKRALAAPTYLDEAPVVVDKRLAKRLAKVDNFLVAVEIAPPIAAMLTARDEREQQKAAIDLAATATGVLVDRMATAKMMALCVGFGVVTGGWGFVACGVGAVAGGLLLGKGAEHVTRSGLTRIAPAPVVLP